MSAPLKGHCRRCGKRTKDPAKVQQTRPMCSSCAHRVRQLHHESVHEAQSRRTWAARALILEQKEFPETDISS